MRSFFFFFFRSSLFSELFFSGFEIFAWVWRLPSVFFFLFSFLLALNGRGGAFGSDVGSVDFFCVFFGNLVTWVFVDVLCFLCFCGMREWGLFCSGAGFYDIIIFRVCVRLLFPRGEKNKKIAQNKMLV